MRHLLITAHWLLITFLAACSSPTPQPAMPEAITFYVIRLNPPALLEYSDDFALQRELPLDLPCGLAAVFPAPRGPRLALELTCINGPVVQVLDTESGGMTTPFTESDSHFLAWTPDGRGLILRVDSIAYPRLIRFDVEDASLDELPLTAFTYDLSFPPDGKTLTYSFSRGLGLGSELWAATPSASRTWQVRAEASQIITFARWSPDGKHIAFINLPDSATPFPMGELWVMDSDGGNARPLAAADAGHGYAAAWSPDSTRLAFVARENPGDAAVEQAAGALVSNIYLVEVGTGVIAPITKFGNTLVEAPVWSPDGTRIAFSAVTDGTIQVWLADPASGEVTPLESGGPACCPGWMRK
ncbi:MAG: TolB family protein [Chloroflexota bacterium]